jgi:hypothetical protein
MAPPEAKTAAKKNSLLANAASSAIGGIIHACIEQPITTPVEASITQMQINGKGFFSNFKELYGRGIWNGLYRAFPTAMAGAAPKAVVHYGSVMHQLIAAEVVTRLTFKISVHREFFLFTFLDLLRIRSGF